MNTLHVEDFIVLGRTVPEDSKKFGKKICMAGYSPGLNQFLRVYPLMLPIGDSTNSNGFKPRFGYTLDLRRNDQDNRIESWRVCDEQNPTTTKWDRAIELPKSEVIQWLIKKQVDSTKHLDACKLSLGVLHIEGRNWDGVMLTRNETDDTEEGATLFSDLEDQDIDPNLVKAIPYIRFTDKGGFHHQLQVREWGAYRLLANPEYFDQPEMLWGAPGYRSGHDMLFIVGNMTRHRNNWLIIKTFEMDKPDSTPSLFD